MYRQRLDLDFIRNGRRRSLLSGLCGQRSQQLRHSSRLIFCIWRGPAILRNSPRRAYIVETAMVLTPLLGEYTGCLLHESHCVTTLIDHGRSKSAKRRPSSYMGRLDGTFLYTVQRVLANQLCFYMRLESLSVTNPNC